MPNDDDNQPLLELMKEYPVPQATDGFYDRALVRATHEGTRRQRNRWLLTGFGGALAAGFAVWLVSGMLAGTPQLSAPDAEIPGVSIALLETRTINLMFASATPLDSATLTVLLPAGIELDGFPDQREVSWETSLRAGKNVLPLRLVARSAMGGELLARLEHDDRNRTFRLRVDVS